MNADWIAGAVVVVGLALCCLALIIYGVWDVVRQRRGENLSITASSWIGKFLARHPFVAVCSGIIVGIMVTHLAAWTTRVTVCAQ
jgi:hypothetical protein